MRQLSVLIKPASSLCNMRCKYCFYADVSDSREVKSYGIMQKETADAVVKNIFKGLQSGDSITFAFQGGEPTLAGLGFFKDFANTAALHAQRVNVKISYSLQTNGLLLDDEWCAFFKKHSFLIGLSLDGPAALHNQNRLDAEGAGTFAKTAAAMRLLNTHKVEFNILCVLTAEAARHPQKMWRFILNENIRYIQFIPCLSGLSNKEKSPWALTPQRFFSFYSALAPLWMAEAEKGNYVSVKLFDDIVNLFVRGQITACGINGKCAPQYVIEADGGVYPCDFYVLDENRLGSMADLSIKDAYEKTCQCGFLENRKSLPPLCAGCKYLPACGGGCKRMANAVYANGGFCGWQKLLDAHGEALCQTGKRLLGSF